MFKSSTGCSGKAPLLSAHLSAPLPPNAKYKGFLIRVVYKLSNLDILQPSCPKEDAKQKLHQALLPFLCQAKGFQEKAHLKAFTWLRNFISVNPTADSSNLRVPAYGTWAALSSKPRASNTLAKLPQHFSLGFLRIYSLYHLKTYASPEPKGYCLGNISKFFGSCWFWYGNWRNQSSWREPCPRNVRSDFHSVNSHLWGTR